MHRLHFGALLMQQVFNAKPYHPFNPQARIVHFHVGDERAAHELGNWVAAMP